MKFYLSSESSFLTVSELRKEEVKIPRKKDRKFPKMKPNFSSLRNNFSKNNFCPCKSYRKISIFPLLFWSLPYNLIIRWLRWMLGRIKYLSNPVTERRKSGGVRCEVGLESAGGWELLRAEPPPPSLPLRHSLRTVIDRQVWENNNYINVVLPIYSPTTLPLY